MNRSKSPVSGKIILLLFMLTAALVLAACGGDGDDDGGNGGNGDTADDTVPTLELAEQEAEDIVSEAPDSDELYAVIQGSTDGELLFTTLCAKCHGLEGKGDGPSAGSLATSAGMDLTAPLAQDKSDEELLQTITVGKNVDMPAWGLILTLEQREAVLAYVRTLAAEE